MPVADKTTVAYAYKTTVARKHKMPRRRPHRTIRIPTRGKSKQLLSSVGRRGAFK
jgi:hypothetical protein